MAKGNTIIRFQDVTFEYNASSRILTDVNFPIREGAKLTLMGQNGAGKSTLFKLITGELEPTEGEIHRDPKTTIAVSKQIIPREQMEDTVREFFESFFEEKIYDIDPRIKKILASLRLNADLDKKVKEFSGGQQARLLMASALIQEPDVLLLDEPTNNLDEEGINLLTQFLKTYDKTVIVISHDADFLNSFTEGVLYLDVFKKTVSQHVGNYFDVLEEIAAEVMRQKRANAQFKKKIQQNKDKINFFAQKGGKMRLLAKKMRAEVAEMEDAKVDVRKDDKTIRNFTIPTQEGLGGVLVEIKHANVMRGNKIQQKKFEIELRKDDHLLLKGPNGVGKTTLLEALSRNEADGVTIDSDVKIGYYRQDFSNLDFDQTVFDCLKDAMKKFEEQKLRSVAAGFLLDKEVVYSKIGSLSEGQKGLVAFARLVLMEPGLLILDEPTNHINFRHIPVIAEAVGDFEGAMILVSHVPDFVDQVGIDYTMDLGKSKPRNED